MTAPAKAIRIHPDDNVAVAIQAIDPGTLVAVNGATLSAADAIPPGHKIALTPIAQDQQVIKYGYPIGKATQTIEVGQHVHTHNIATRLGHTETYTYEPIKWSHESIADNAAFDGFPRADGQVGIRNDIWIIPTVGCVNRIARELSQQAKNLCTRGTVERVIAFEHPYGCSQLGDDLLNTQKLLAALARHPNAGGVLVVGLGCENNNIAAFQTVLGQTDPNRVKFLCTQDVENEYTAGMTLIEQLVHNAQNIERQPIPASRLKVGLKCGASDGFSGITANPLLGAFSDQLIAMGGTTLLTEVPEMFGAETILMNRCATPETFERCVKLIDNFKSYYTAHGQPVHENPSPGNKEGGITTLEEKSFGCIQKGGSSPVVDVLDYTQSALKTGLNLVSAPGNDIVSTTALAAAGAHLVLFTTGRGTPLGGPVPTIKIASHTSLAKRKPTWIDFDAGVALEGVPLNELASQLFATVLEIVSGQKSTRNERKSFHDIAIFKNGVTL